MIFGLNNNFWIGCDNCPNTIGLVQAMSQQHLRDLNEIYTCSCGNTFTLMQGLVNDFCSDHFFSAYHFISNIYKQGQCTITVGTTHIIDLGDEIPIINKIILTHQSGVVFIEPKIVNDRKSIKIISSEVTDNVEFWKDSILKVGDNVGIDWMLFGKTSNLKIEPFRQLLIQAKEQLIDKKYLMSFFSSATALESYLNYNYNEYLTKKGISEKAIEIFLKESTMPEKVFNLLQSLLKISVAELTVSNTKLEKIIRKRNQIAHGKLVEIIMEDAKETFRNVITSIFEIELQKIEILKKEDQEYQEFLKKYPIFNRPSKRPQK